MSTSRKDSRESRTSRGTSHVGRSSDERQRYIEYVVRGRRELVTAPPLHETEGAATDSFSTTADEDLTVVPSTTARTSRQPGLWEKHRDTIIKSVLGALAIMLIGWFGATLFSLNREVGETIQNLKNTSRTLEGLDKGVSKSEERSDRRFERTERRLDALDDRISSFIDEIRTVRSLITSNIQTTHEPDHVVGSSKESSRSQE
ncbi:MAG: hypothetical protein KAU41_05810 [Deltaproteobacteria bacterium]|jgi:hypothetical protein|nr:hypothetical protein [Deltaproteobacteria bacterium]